MSALNLPKPVNNYAGEDELRNVNAGPNGTANGNGNGAAPNGEPVEEEVVEEYRAPRRSDKFLAGIIYPPKEIRGVSCSLSPVDSIPAPSALSAFLIPLNLTSYTRGAP